MVGKAFLYLGLAMVVAAAVKASVTCCAQIILIHGQPS